MKFYVDYLTNVMDFDGADFGLVRDENGVYCTDKDMFKWLLGLDAAIEKLIENGINVQALQVNDYDDYIKIADEL